MQNRLIKTTWNPLWKQENGTAMFTIFLRQNQYKIVSEMTR